MALTSPGRRSLQLLGHDADVVEGATGRRLAVECDGDKYHGPERWADDMRRQRILERVGWRFWRCWASSFVLDPDGCMADLFATLDRFGIENDASARAATFYTAHVRAARKVEPGPASDKAEGKLNGATAPPRHCSIPSGTTRSGSTIAWWCNTWMTASC